MSYFIPKDQEEKGFKKWLRRKQLELDEESQTVIHHSTGYHSHFEGYSEVRRPNASGKGTHVERMYVGQYRRRVCTDEEWKATKITYALMYLLCVACFFFAISRPLGLNRTWYTALPGLLSIISLLILLGTLFNCWLCKRSITAGEYRSSFHRLPLICLITGSLLLATAFSMVIQMILNGIGDSLLSDLLALLGSVAGAYFIFLIARQEKLAGYEIVENDQKLPDDGVIIQ